MGLHCRAPIAWARAPAAPYLVGTRLPRPYHFPARIQSFQAIAAPFPGMWTAPIGRRPTLEERAAAGPGAVSKRLRRAKEATRARRLLGFAPGPIAMSLPIDPVSKTSNGCATYAVGSQKKLSKALPFPSFCFHFLHFPSHSASLFSLSFRESSVFKGLRRAPGGKKSRVPFPKGRQRNRIPEAPERETIEKASRLWPFMKRALAGSRF